MYQDRNLLARYVREPDRLAEIPLEVWDRLIPAARSAGLLARLALSVERRGLLAAVPERVRPHLASARILAEKHTRDARHEINRLAELLTPIVGRVILLKGGAYLAAGLPPAPGRTFNDIDILVPRSALDGVEALLNLAGWRYGEIDPYDDRYYRRWMHQLPPMLNASLRSTVDVHHTLIPTTSRIRLDVEAVLRSAEPVPGRPDLAVLSPPDMVLHSAVHLIADGEFYHGIRDLDDLNLLLRHFGAAPAFWESLVERARALDLTRPLYYVLRYASMLLGTPVPTATLRATEPYGPGPPLRWLMDALFLRALRSPHPDSRDALSGTALMALYIRAHYLRMPLHMLLPHLTRKALRPSRPQEEASAL